jgi:hypothetical protein
MDAYWLVRHCTWFTLQGLARAGEAQLDECYLQASCSLEDVNGCKGQRFAARPCLLCQLHTWTRSPLGTPVCSGLRSDKEASSAEQQIYRRVARSRTGLVQRAKSWRRGLFWYT